MSPTRPLAAAAFLAACAACAPLAIPQPGDPARPQTARESAGVLLGEVCLPFVLDGRAEADVTAGRGFQLRPHAPLSTEDVRFHHYATSYPGIRVLTLYETQTERRCTFDLPDTRDDPRESVETTLKGRSEPWTPQAIRFGLPETAAIYFATACWRAGEAGVDAMGARFGWSVTVGTPGRCQR